MNTIIKGAMLVALLSSSSCWANESDSTPPGEKIKQGLTDVKEGTTEAAKEVGTAAEKVGQSAADTGRKVGRSLKAATCPVVGDRNTKLYYAQDSKSYDTVLEGQKYFQDDDRECFMTEQAARSGGYKRSAG